MTVKDPRDERATLVRIEDLEVLFHFPLEETEGPRSIAQERAGQVIATVPSEDGRLTPEWRSRIEALRIRISSGDRVADSIEIIREEREERSRAVYGAVFGGGEKSGGTGDRPMTVVVDASVALKWVLQETHTEEALDLWDRWQEGDERIVAPPHLPSRGCERSPSTGADGPS